jgi:hypothetical protein
MAAERERDHLRLDGGLEGAMLVSRPYRDVQRFRDAAELLIRGLAAER